MTTAFNHGDLVMGAIDGFTGREVVYDLTTELAIVVELRGEAAAVTAATVYAHAGVGDPVTLSGVDIATNGQVLVSVTAANLRTLFNVSDAKDAMFGQFDVRWDLTVTDGARSRQARLREKCWVAEYQVPPVVPYSRFTTRWPEIAKECNWPTGQTSLQPQADQGYRNLRNWLASQGYGGRWPWMVSAPQMLDPLEDAYKSLALATSMATFSGSDYWGREALAQAKQIERLQGEVVLYWQTSSVESAGKKPAQEADRLKQPFYKVRAIGRGGPLG